MRDLLLTEGFDLDFTATGDLKVGEATQQHKKCLLVAHKGDWRQFPWVGVGIGSYVLDDAFAGVQQEIQKQFELDGLRIESLEVRADGTINEKSGY